MKPDVHEVSSEKNVTRNATVRTMLHADLTRVNVFVNEVGTEPIVIPLVQEANLELIVIKIALIVFMVRYFQ